MPSNIVLPHRSSRSPLNQRYTGKTAQSPLMHLLFHPIVVGLWVIFCVVSGISLVRSGLSSRNVLEQKKAALEELRKEEQKGMQLIEQLQHANSTGEKERIIREELRMQKPGEIILQLPTTSSNPSESE